MIQARKALITALPQVRVLPGPPPAVLSPACFINFNGTANQVPKKTKQDPALYEKLYDMFEAAISRYDCGRKCAPLNGGEPVCCSTEHAVPIVHKVEWQFLKSRTDLWHGFKAYDAQTREIVETMASNCTAIECRGARHCERENRSLACRAFPFFPYITREGEFKGLSYMWEFEDRCWVISHLEIVDAEFVKQCIAAYDLLFDHDPEELEGVREHSANMRRVFSRWNRAIPLIGRDGNYWKVLPHGRGIVRARLKDFRRHGPYVSERAYRKAVAEESRD